MAYKIDYSSEAEAHVSRLPRHQQVVVLDGVDRQLTQQPTVETRNRKPMRPNPLAPWELRLGNLRVYYDVDEDTETVVILAVGVKERNKVRIGGEIVEL